MYKKSIEVYGDGIGKVEYVQHLGTDETLVSAARISFASQSKGLSDKDKKLIRYLLKNQHVSVLEHNFLTCKWTVPIYVARQHMRHRTFSFCSINEVSRRYTSEDIKFYCPDKFRTQHKLDKQASNEDELINPVVWDNNDCDISSEIYKKHCHNSLCLYEQMIEEGVCREQARGVLPQSMYTQYWMTANLNNLLKFLDLRLDSHAQWEIKKVAEAMQEIMIDLWPITMQTYKELRENNV